MKLDIDLNICGLPTAPDRQDDILRALRQLERIIMASQAQLAQDLKTIGDQVTKIGTETTTLLEKVTALETAVANAGNTTPEVDEAVANLRAQAQAVDDLVSDATPPAPAPETP